MDPLSLTASIIAVLQLSGNVISYLNGVKDASKESNSILLEVSSVTGLLYTLRNLIDTDKGDGYLDVVRSLAVPSGPLDQFKAVLEQLSKQLQPVTGVRKAARVFKWPFKKEEVKELLATIERQKTLFSFAIQNDQVRLSRGIESDVVDIKRMVQLLELQSRSGDDSKMLSWFTPLEPEKTHLDTRERRLPGTGEWLLHKAEFIAWRDDKTTSKVLWCHGIPGAGKTVLSSLVFDHLDEQLPKKSAVLIFYCDYREQKSQSLFNVVASMLKQLADLSLVVMEMMRQLYKTHGQQNKDDRTLFPKLDLLFRAACGEFSEVYLVIDALDECDPKDHRKPFLNWLQSLDFCRLFLTSRPHPNDLQRAFKGYPQITIEASNDDVEKYLRATIADDEDAMDLMDDDLVEHVVTTITENAQGIFLLPRLQIQTILNEPTRRGMRDALKELPPSLNENLGQTLKRINQQPTKRAELALKTLEWIFLAKRPFSTKELCQGLSVMAGDVRVEDGSPLPKQMVDYCLGLVALDEVSGNIRLVHFTVQEYLNSEADKVFASLGDGLTQACLTFLNFDELKKGPCPSDEDYETRREMLPFFEYAAQYWGAHLREHPSATNDQLANTFLTCGTCVLSICQCVEMAGGDHAWGDNSQRYTKYNALHLAAKEGLTTQVQFLLESGTNVDISDGKTGTALHLAATSSCETAAVLVQHGADVSLVDEENATALHIAVKAGSLEMVQLLLDAKADMAAKDEYGRTALHLAVEEHRKDISDFLIKEGMDVSAEDNNGDSVLHAAALAGDEVLVKLVLEKGSDVNALNDSFSTAAHNAAWGGFEGILRMLHAHGANMDAIDEMKLSPLHQAASKGYFRSLRFLLECGADPKRAASSGESVLHSAAWGGNVECVQLLLDSGADINAKNKSKESVLYSSCENRHEDVFMFLVEHGAVLDHGNAADKKYLLSYAASNGRESIVRYLVEHGADIECVNSESSTPLHCAAESGHSAIVTYLVDQGADIKKKGWCGHTILHAAAEHCNIATVRLLLDKGADVNAIDDAKKTALHLATNNKDEKEIVTLLITSGADVNAKDKYGVTVLHDALSCGNEDLVPILIAHGADATAKSNFGGNAWFYAAQETYKKAVFELLSEKGAKHDEPNENGLMPLHLAMEHDNGALVRYLLENGADARAVTTKGSQVLHFLRGDQVDIVELLISKGADPDAKTTSGSTVLAIFLENGGGNIDVIKTLVEHGADVNAATTDRITVLHRAAKNASAEILRYMIDKGARVDAKSKAGTTVLSKVVDNDDAERCTMLLAEKGADLEERNRKGQTTLLAATDTGTYSNRALIRYLVESGANVKARDLLGNSVLHSSGVLRALSLTKYLLDKGASVNALNKLGVLPLHIAAKKGYMDTVQLLVDRGATPKGADQAGVSVLCRAASKGETAIAAYLIEKGANVNHCDKNGMAPLHYAVENRHEEVARLLVEEGANVNARTSTGATVLHKAVIAANMSTVKYLLSKGAETHWKENDTGFTALHRAVKGDPASANKKGQGQKIPEALKIEGDVAVAKVLLEHGADINAVDANGEVALKMAVKEKLIKMIVLLIQHGARTDVGTTDGEEDDEIYFDLCFWEAKMWINDHP